ncbi:MAG: helix-hairpin-helix domain-containing protein [bacterium]|nr:helix-hairpin-helix domain-containing protein [bacterium]
MPLLSTRQRLGILLAFLVVLGGRAVRHYLLLGPEGHWREELWLDAVLAAAEPPAPPPAPPPKPQLTTPLPVNTCSVDSLTMLPGVGPVLAGRMAAARTAAGPFRDAADLQRVKGIGPALSARLGPLVLFTGTASVDSIPSGDR